MPSKDFIRTPMDRIAGFRSSSVINTNLNNTKSVSHRSSQHKHWSISSSSNSSSDKDSDSASRVSRHSVLHVPSRSSSSSSSDCSHISKRLSRRSRRSRSPPAPKMQVFSGDGKSERETFNTQFLRTGSGTRDHDQVTPVTPALHHALEAPNRTQRATPYRKVWLQHDCGLIAAWLRSYFWLQ